MLGEVRIGLSPAYILDAAGNLIRLRATCSPEALIPFGAEIVSSASELKHPLAWTITPEMIIERISMLPKSLLLENELSAVINNGRLPTAAFPFVPASAAKDSDENIVAALEVMDALDESDPTKLELEKELNTVGVYRIPRTPAFCEGIHLKVKPTNGFEYVSDGWMSCMKVYRKTVVRSH